MAKSKKYRVFVVDDDAKYLALFKHHVENHTSNNVEVKVFDNGETFLEGMREKPDVIILDHYLNGSNPGARNGMEYLKDLKVRDPDIPVVMMSGQNDLQLVVDMFEEGASDYIIKNETSFLRGSIIVDNVIKNIEQKTFAKDQKRIQYALIFLVLLLVGVTVAVATFVN